MPAFSNNEKTDMLLLLGESLGNAREAARLYGLRYADRRQPSPNTISNLLRNLRQEGSLVKTRRPRADRVVANDEIVGNVLAAVAQNPHVSSRVVGREVGCSHTAVLSILHLHKFHPFKVHLHHAMTAQDMQRRTEFCLNLQQKIAEDDQFLNHVLWSDESTFHRDGTVNRHNLHYWAEQNPHWLRQDNHQVRWKTNVWAGILGDRIIGPYFFPDNLNANMYLDFLIGDLTIALDQLPGEATNNMYFQQDGAPPHYGHGVRQWLNEHYPNRWIGRGGPFPWPARSPDLTPLDFFLWGYVKSLVYETQPRDLEDLKGRIREAINQVTPAMLAAVRRSLTGRLEDCLTQDGGHIEHLH